MIFFEKEYDFDYEDRLTHIRIPLSLDKNYSEMIIKFDYSPRLTPLEISKPLVDAAIEKYIPVEHRKQVKDIYLKDFKIENLITTSLTYNGKYIGAWHNKLNNQEIKISKDFSSLGYKRHEILAGNYIVTLSIHSVNCPVKAHLILEMN